MGPGTFQLVERMSFEQSTLPILLKVKTQGGDVFSLQGGELLAGYKRPQSFLLFEENAGRVVLCAVNKPVTKSCDPQLYWFTRRGSEWLYEEGHPEGICVVP
jgi:hypothetical protein